MQWLRNLFSRRQHYDDLAVSIREHLQERVDELIENGMPRAEAEQKARREFGNVTVLEERGREAWQWSAVETMLADVKLAFRRLRKSPGFTITVLLTLGIGIGANTAVFSVVNSVLLRPLKYPEPDRLVSLHQEAPGAAGLAAFANGLRLSPSMYFTYSEHNRTMQSVGVWMRGTANVTGIATPEEVHTVHVTDGVLESLGVPPIAGRWFSHTDQDPHGARTVMLGYGYWQRRFGADRSVIGRTIQIDSQSAQIIGVMPRGFRVVNRDFDMLLPLRFERNNQPLAGFGFEGIARLKPGVSISQANADITRMLPIWMDSFSNGPGIDSHLYEAWKITPSLRPLKQEVIGETRDVLWLVMATIGLVMLIACTNVTNLLLVRADARQQELSVRAALGAGRGRMVRELLLESVLLGLLGGVLGVGIAYGGLRLLTAIGPTDLPRLSEISIDFTSLAFTFLLSLLSGLVFGSIPALKYSRVPGASLLSGSTRTASIGRERQHSRNFMVVAQVAMAMVLLVCALLMIRTFQTLRHVEPGFSDARHVQTMRISIPPSMVSDAVAITRLEEAIAAKLATIPGVSSVGFGESVPMDGLEFGWDEVQVVGRSNDHTMLPLRLFNNVSPGYFPTLGTRMIAGRDFNWEEIYASGHQAIITKNLARELFGTPEAAIGRHIQRFRGPASEVVGVVEDIRQNGVDQKPPAIVYWPVLTMEFRGGKSSEVYGSPAVAFVVRSGRSGSAGFFSELEQAVWSVNANLPVALIETMQDVYDRSLEKTSFALVMLAIAGSMALALGIIGIYGVISFAVSQRTREIGIRVALGAQRGGLKWMFVRSAINMTGIGVVIGAAAAAGLTQLMKSLLYGISPLDPFTFIVIPLVLIASAVLASYLPARHAASVDPVEALRAE
jgi:predicted permease